MIGTIPYFPQSPLITSFDSLQLPRTLSRSLLYTPSSTPFLFFPPTPYHSLLLLPTPSHLLSFSVNHYSSPTPYHSFLLPLILCQSLFFPHSLPLLLVQTFALPFTSSHYLSYTLLHALTSPTTPYHSIPLISFPSHSPSHSLTPSHILLLPPSFFLLIPFQCVSAAGWMY